MWYPSLITENPSRARQPMSRENGTGLLRLLQDFFQITIENIYLFKIVIEKKHGNVFKTWLCPNFCLAAQKMWKKKKSQLPKIWEAAAPLAPRPVHLCILGNLVIKWPYTARPSAPQAHQYKITQSTDIATQMQRKKIAWPPGLLERGKNLQSRVFFDVIFDVYTHVNNRERARETKFVGRKTRKFHSGGEKMRNASGQVKMSGSEKIKANMNTGNKIFGKHHTEIPPQKCATTKFEVLRPVDMEVGDPS